MYIGIRASCHRPDSRKQLLRVKRLGKIIIGAAVKSLHLIIYLRLRCQHQHRNHIPCRSQLLKRRNSIHLWHHHVHYHSVIVAALKIFQRLRTVIYGIHGKIIFFKYSFHRSGKRFLVLRKKKSHIKHPPITLFFHGLYKL